MTAGVALDLTDLERGLLQIVTAAMEGLPEQSGSICAAVVREYLLNGLNWAIKQIEHDLSGSPADPSPFDAGYTGEQYLANCERWQAEYWAKQPKGERERRFREMDRQEAIDDQRAYEAWLRRTQPTEDQTLHDYLRGS